MRGLERFQRALSKAGMKDLRPWLTNKKNWKLLAAEIHKDLFNSGEFTPPHKPTGRQRYQHLIAHYLTEILKSFDTLKDIEFYMGRFPYKNTMISRERHLQFHVEAYLHEVYVLEQRLLQTLIFIERQHRRDPRLPEIKIKCEALKEFVRTALEKITRLRGSHVHQARFSHRQLDRLWLIKLYTLGKESKLTRTFRAFYRIEYRRTRDHWRGMIATANGSTGTLLDEYFDALFPIIFKSSRVMNYPSRLKF